jgi:multimeric flavodoxin WrbA
MMMKIIGIVGSPRRNGNTHVLVSRILGGARAEGAKTRTIFLRDLDISECDGCFACWKGKYACRKADDMRDLYPKIAEADAIVLGSPVYWFGPTAIMKAFIDRLTYFGRPRNGESIRNMPAVIAVPFADRTREASSPVVEMFAKSLDFLGMRLVGKVLAPGVNRRGEVRTRRRVMASCHETGRRLAIDGGIDSRQRAVADGGAAGPAQRTPCFRPGEAR